MSGKPSPVASRRIKTPDMYSRTDDVPETIEQAPRTKRTYLLPDEVVEMLEDYQHETRKRTKQKPDLSDIVANAIREYVQKNSKAA